MNSDRIHVVFGHSSKGILLYTRKMGHVSGTIVSLNDDLRVGPIPGLGLSNYIIKRQNWLVNCISCLEEFEHLYSNTVEDYTKIQKLKAEQNNDRKIYIWCGRTTFDKLATARLVYELRDQFSNLFITAIPEVKIKSKHGHYYVPECLSIMNPEEIYLIKKYFKKLTKKECEVWVNLWVRLSKDNRLMRTFTANGIIESKEESYFDKILLSNCTSEFLKATRVVGTSLIDIELEASDSTLNWRLMYLAKNKMLEFNGKLNCIREYSVKHATTKFEVH